MKRLLRLYLLIFIQTAFVGIGHCQHPGAVSVVVSRQPNVHSPEVRIGSDDTEDGEIFQASRDWQTIKPGQVLPAGLHVRINLQTGQKEAKLLDDSNSVPDKEKYSHWITEDGRQGIFNKQSNTFTLRELKEALKTFKEETRNEDEAIKQARKKFRSIEELRKEFAELNLNVRTDVELLAELLSRYPDAENQTKRAILNDLEYVVHQYDAAQEFVKMGGLQVILPDLNSTEAAVRAMVAYTIGSAMQGNPRVQIAVLETNALHQFLRLAALDGSLQVQAKALYALSCLVRQFPFAQQRLVESGGLSAFADMFRLKELEATKLQLKVVTLVNDLVTERMLAIQHAGDPTFKEKLQQYEKIPLEESLVQHGFCSLIPKLLLHTEYDVQEKVIVAMSSLCHVCRGSFTDYVPIMHKLAKEYWQKALEDSHSGTSHPEGNSSDGDTYFSQLHNLVIKLADCVEPKLKDEL